MTDTDGAAKRPAASYISYQTLGTFIAPLKEHVIPTRIDKSLLKSMSGAVQGQLMSSIRFLGLIDENSRPTPVLKELVSAYGTDKWRSALETVLRKSYSELFKLPLASVTPSEFNEAFKKAYPCEGETLRKGVTFFLNAGRDAGVEFSPFLTANAKPRTGPTPKRRLRASNKREAAAAPNGTPSNRANDTNGTGKVTDQLLAKFPSFDPAWPDEIKAKWFDGYERLLGMTQKGTQ